MNPSTIFKMVESGLRLSLEVVKIIQDKGDGAGNVRLKDIKGFAELKRKVNLHDRAVRRFRDKVKPI